MELVSGKPVEQNRESMTQVRVLSSRNFAVNVNLSFTSQGQRKACIAENSIAL
jgi:hypothetical protein